MWDVESKAESGMMNELFGWDFGKHCFKQCKSKMILWSNVFTYIVPGFNKVETLFNWTVVWKLLWKVEIVQKIYVNLKMRILKELLPLTINLIQNILIWD